MNHAQETVIKQAKQAFVATIAAYVPNLPDASLQKVANRYVAIKVAHQVRRDKIRGLILGT